MNKRRIMTLALALCMVAILAIGGTLAYFTDTDNADNVFTVGGVSIDLIEQERNEAGDALVNYDHENPNELWPIIGSAQGEKDEFDQPIAKNYVDKIITVKNDGASEAFVRLYFAIPSFLDDGYDTYNAGLNILHFNWGTVQKDGKWVTTFNNQWKWFDAENPDGQYNFFTTLIGDDGVMYNVYYAEYYQPLAPKATTEVAIKGVYLDTTFNYDDDNNAYVMRKGENGEMEQVYIYKDAEKKVNVTNKDMETITLPVFAIGCQTAGFKGADETAMDAYADAAFAEAFKANTTFKYQGGAVTNHYNPWME